MVGELFQLCGAFIDAWFEGSWQCRAGLFSVDSIDIHAGGLFAATATVARISCSLPTNASSAPPWAVMAKNVSKCYLVSPQNGKVAIGWDPLVEQSLS